MKLATVHQAGQLAPVVLDGDLAVPVAARSIADALTTDANPRAWRTGAPLPEPWERTVPIRPGKIVAIGLNYHDHIRETGMEPPSAPLVFAKFPTSLIGPTDAVVLPSVAPDHVDWEVELAVVIGRRMRHVAAEQCLEYVAGYTVANDVSARDVQLGDGQWTRGKSFDTFCPLGPHIVTADEIDDPQALGLRTLVNGEAVQSSSTSEMLFSVAEILSYCAACFTLEPGDLILTGTPWGCGGFSKPQRYLRAGDVMESVIDGIGTLRNRVVGPEHVDGSSAA